MEFARLDGEVKDLLASDDIEVLNSNCDIKTEEHGSLPPPSYTCEICSFDGVTLTGLSLHCNTVHEGKTWKCSFCQVTFRQALFLNEKCATQKSFVATLTVSCGCYQLLLKAKGVNS